MPPIDFTPLRQDLTFYAGDSLSIKFQKVSMESGAPVDITGATFIAVVIGEEGKELLRFDSEANPATIIVDGANGTIELKQTAATMAAQKWCKGRYDLQQTGPTGGFVSTWFTGIVSLKQDISRIAE